MKRFLAPAVHQLKVFLFWWEIQSSPRTGSKEADSGGGEKRFWILDSGLAVLLRSNVKCGTEMIPLLSDTRYG